MGDRETRGIGTLDVPTSGGCGGRWALTRTAAQNAIATTHAVRVRMRVIETPDREGVSSIHPRAQLLFARQSAHDLRGFHPRVDDLSDASDFLIQIDPP